jgi:hypothetical protein
MSAERPWAGGYFFPRLVVYLAAIVNLAGIAALIILIIAEFIILVNNFQSYVARYGYRYRASHRQLGLQCRLVLMT